MEQQRADRPGGPPTAPAPRPPWWQRRRTDLVHWLPAALAAVSWLIGAGTVGVVLQPPAVLSSAIPTAALIIFRIAMERHGDRIGVGSPIMIMIFVVHQAVLLVGIAFNPFLCIYAFVGYLDAMRWFVGRQQWVLTAVTGVWSAFGQTGSIPGLVNVPLLFVGLTVINIGVAGAMLQVGRDRERQIDERERAAEELARVTGDNAALQDQLIEQAHATGVAQERARLSREIHDTVAQGLVAVIRQLEAVPSDDVGPGARERIERAEESARDCLIEARRAVAALAPHQLDDTPLVTALEGLVRRWARSHRIVCQLDTDRAPDGVGAEAVLLRVAQEGLSNVARHAGASSVTVVLATRDGRTVLEIVDDGDGFDPATAPRGRGLAGMRERLAAVDGGLELVSDAAGTTVRAWVPEPPVLVGSPAPESVAR